MGEVVNKIKRKADALQRNLARVQNTMARLRREEEIHCPYCGDLYEDDEGYCVTYHGDKRPGAEVDCASCKLTFLVEETVRRTYETFASPQTDRGDEIER